MAYKWVHSSAYSSVPENAVVGGNDSDGTMMYVGRAFHNGDTLVAKVMPAKQIAYISWRGEEVPKYHFEILCGSNLIWQQCYDHNVPENAVLCGKTALDQPVYIGRGHHEGSLTVGKISSVHKALFIPFNGSEKRLETYEVLLEDYGKPNVPGWIYNIKHEEYKTTNPFLETSTEIFPPPPPPYTPNEVKPEIANIYPPVGFEPPPYASLAAKPFTYTPSVVPSAAYEPAETKPSICSPYPMPLPTPTAPFPIIKSATTYHPPSAPITPATTYQPPSASITPAETYQPPSASITPAETYQPPSAASFTPAVSYQPPVITSTPAHTHNPTPNNTSDMWISVNGSYIPADAVQAGHNVDLSKVLVARAYHCGDLIPGKAIQAHTCAYIPYKGREVPVPHYEVLVGNHYDWVPARDGNIAPGAVEAGRSVSGEPFYVGRTYFNGNLLPGKIQMSHRCLYITHGGYEHRMHDYEVLVRRSAYYRDQAHQMLY